MFLTPTLLHLKDYASSWNAQNCPTLDLVSFPGCTTGWHFSINNEMRCVPFCTCGSDQAVGAFGPESPFWRDQDQGLTTLDSSPRSNEFCDDIGEALTTGMVFSIFIFNILYDIQWAGAKLRTDAQQKKIGELDKILIMRGANWQFVSFLWVGVPRFLGPREDPKGLT